MFRIRSLSIAAGSVVLVSLLSPGARASVWDKRTIVDLHDRVEVPGAVLEPGKYVMKLLDSPSSRNIVQFMNERENHVYSTTFAIPVYRSEPAEKTILTFYEVPAGQPELLKDWFYPGDTTGFEFTYPKGRALEIADASHVNVPSTPSTGRFSGQDNSPSTPPAPSPLSATAAPQAGSSAPPVNTAQAAPAPVEVAAASPEPQASTSSTQPSGSPAASSSSSTVSDQTLPKTASPIPSLAILGALGIGGALGFRRLKREPSRG